MPQLAMDANLEWTIKRFGLSCYPAYLSWYLGLNGLIKWHFNIPRLLLMLNRLKLSLVMKCMHILLRAYVFLAIIFFMNYLQTLVKHNTANMAVPCATGTSKDYCTVAVASVRSWNITTGRAKKVLWALQTNRTNGRRTKEIHSKEGFRKHAKC